MSIDYYMKKEIKRPYVSGPASVGFREAGVSNIPKRGSSGTRSSDVSNLPVKLQYHEF